MYVKFEFHQFVNLTYFHILGLMSTLCQENSGLQLFYHEGINFYPIVAIQAAIFKSFGAIKNLRIDKSDNFLQFLTMLRKIKLPSPFLFRNES